MKTQLIFLITMCCFVCSIQAQKPFTELGLDNEVEVITLSNGRYIEHVEDDTLRQIGSVMFNMNTNKVEYFIPEDDLEKVRIASRDREVSRFMAVDPLASKYPHNSPYAFSENVVINAIELEGLEKLTIHMSKTRTNGGKTLVLKYTILWVEEDARQVSAEGMNDKNRLADIYINKKRTQIASSEDELTAQMRNLLNKKEVVKTKKELTLIEANESGQYQDNIRQSNDRIFEGIYGVWKFENDKINYETDGSSIGKDEERIIRNAASALLEFEEISLNIVGRTSLAGSDNQNLSNRRANELKQAIIGYATNELGATKEQIDSLKTRINAIGKGSTGAKDADGSGDDPDDRRTDIIYR